MPTPPSLRARRTALVGGVAAAALAAALPVAAASSASAAAAVTCTSGVSYAASTNTIRVTGASAPTTLPGVLAACPSAPIAQVDPAGHVWELRGDLVISGGASLSVQGAGSGVDPASEVDELRLQSSSDQVATHVAMLEADNGSLTLDHTHVRSWDDATGAVDSDTSVAACPSGTKTASCPRGRAFVRALADPNSDGSWGSASLVIRNSEVDHLGYYSSTTYGVSYKTQGTCSHTDPASCGHVTGAETDSTFHDDYMGTYTWGAKGVDFLRNTYTHNTMYGLDPHDASTYLDIEGDHFSYNGDHGLICSQACDHLTITGNESDHNGLTPWKGPAGDDSDGQVHGIMLHRGVTNTVVSGNSVHDNPNGAGIAIFDTAGDTISGNTLTANKYGIRLSVGASDTFTDNTIAGSTAYGVYTYVGKDVPSFTTTGGRPTGNAFTGGSITGTASNPIKLTDTDSTTFSGVSITGSTGALSFVGARDTQISGGTLLAKQKITSAGDTTGGSTTTLADPAVALSISDDASSSTDVTSSRGALFTTSGGALPTTATPDGSAVQLTSAATGTTGSVTATPQLATVVPASGSATATTTSSGTGRHVTLTEASPVATQVTEGGLTAGKTYKVLRAGVQVTTATVDGSGTLTFTDTPPSASATDYTLKS